MYFTAAHKNIKLHQDYSGCKKVNHSKKIVICDGIGSLKNSEIVAEIIGDCFINDIFFSIEEIPNSPTYFKEGGTTIIFAKTENDRDVYIEYIGNGGIINIAGDFAETPYSNYPYRYAEILLPHVDSKGALTKHLSHNSGIKEHTPSKLALTPNHPSGNILLLYTDGINSLENNLILKDRENRFWRNESSAIQYILNLLDSFLMKESKGQYNADKIQDALLNFNKDVLEALNKDGYLEDDASLGIIITQTVFDYYQSKSNE
jgi:hypothetical protein